MTHEPNWFSISSALGSREGSWIGRAVAFERIWRPNKVLLDGERLRWSMSLTPRPKPYSFSRGRVLDGFLGLERAEFAPDAVLGFARKYGPLVICAHNLPAFHPRAGEAGCILGNWTLHEAGADSDRECVPLGWEWPANSSPKLELWEPLSAWAFYVKRAKTLLSAAALLRARQLVPQAVWFELDGINEEFARHPVFRDLDFFNYPTARLMENANWWLSLTRVAPQMSVEGRWLKMVLHSRASVCGVLGQIAVELAASIAGAEKLGFCSNCGRLCAFRIDPGERVAGRLVRRTYCDKCRRKKIPERDAARDYRRRSALQNKWDD